MPANLQTTITGTTYQEYLDNLSSLVSSEKGSIDFSSSVEDVNISRNVPLVFLPGIGAKCADFYDRIQFVQDKGIRTIPIDWPAFDLNSFNFSHHASWVIGRLKDLGIKKAGFFGQSRGGLGVIKILNEFPEYVSFAIINSAPAGKDIRDVPLWLRGCINFLCSSPDWLMNSLFRTLNYIPVDGVKSWGDFLTKNNPRELGSCYKDHLSRDWRLDTEKITSEIPVVFRYGMKDNWVKWAGNIASKSCKKALFLDAPTRRHGPPEGEEILMLMDYCLSQVVR